MTDKEKDGFAKTAQSLTQEDDCKAQDDVEADDYKVKEDADDEAKAKK
jgi:hypothetical protein